MGQSKADEALPLLDEILVDEHAPKVEIARAARLYATALYLLNRNSAAKQREMASRAVQFARECDDKELLAHALLESARAGLESGVEAMITSAREELRRMIATFGLETPAIAFHANAFCSYHLLDVREAAKSAVDAVRGLSKEGRFAELALAHTGLGNCMTAMCRQEEALEAFQTALELSQKIGDDSRVSILCSNMAASCLLSGDMERAIEYGEKSLLVASRAPSQPVLPKAWSNLAFAYLLSGNLSRARECYELPQEWIRDGRSWAITTTFCFESAALELAFGHPEEALKRIADAERDATGRADWLASPGTSERMKVFFTYHSEGHERARCLADAALRRFRGRHQFAYLEALAAFAWLEKVLAGRYSDWTGNELRLFEIHGCGGKRAVLAAQGFLD
jgi:tetratricopeptide (TPR) repeat protein